MKVTDEIKARTKQRVLLGLRPQAIYVGKNTYDKLKSEIEGYKQIDMRYNIQIDMRYNREKYDGMFIYIVDDDEHLRVF